jgi:hypothetical protein
MTLGPSRADRTAVGKALNSDVMLEGGWRRATRDEMLAEMDASLGIRQSDNPQNLLRGISEAAYSCAPGTGGDGVIKGALTAAVETRSTLTVGRAKPMTL